VPIFTRFHSTPTGALDHAKLEIQGPVLSSEIAIPTSRANSLSQAGQTIHQPFPGKALIDTGASVTCVEETILTQLGIPILRTSLISTPDGPTTRNVYPCRISFPGTPIPPKEFTSIVGTDLKNFGCIALIGRDILKDYQLVYNGKEGFWTLAF